MSGIRWATSCKAVSLKIIPICTVQMKRKKKCKTTTTTTTTKQGDTKRLRELQTNQDHKETKEPKRDAA